MKYFFLFFMTMTLSLLYATDNKNEAARKRALLRIRAYRRRHRIAQRTTTPVLPIEDTFVSGLPAIAKALNDLYLDAAAIQQQQQKMKKGIKEALISLDTAYNKVTEMEETKKQPPLLAYFYDQSVPAQRRKTPSVSITSSSSSAQSVSRQKKESPRRHRSISHLPNGRIHGRKQRMLRRRGIQSTRTLPKDH